jgi:hypothetical protein
MSDTAFFLLLLQQRGCEIVPAEFRNKAIPDDEITRVEPASVLITPFQDFFVGPAFRYTLT